MAKRKFPKLSAERVERWAGSGLEWALVSENPKRPLTEKEANAIAASFAAVINLGLIRPGDFD
jgi:hypothetical protein